MRNLILVFVLFITGFQVWSQDDDFVLPTVIPPSPNAASLGEFGQVPVGMNTGTMQLGIPVHTFKSRKLSVPITFNYSSNGIRVDQLSSHVGMGWSLNAGGVITRTIYDDPDEIGSLAIPDDTSIYTEEMYEFLLSATNEGHINTQPDIFSYNFNGFAGKFYLDDNMKVILLEPSPLDIELVSSLSDPISNSNPVFLIRDPSGIEYYFGGDTASELTINRSSGCGSHSPLSLEAQTAWYLTKVKHYSGDEVLFNYTKFSNNYNSGLTQTYTKKYNNLSLLYVGASECTYINKVTGEISLLTDIQSEGFGSVNFSYSIGITNPDGNKNQKLDSISVYDKNNKLIKGFHMDYQIYGSDLSYSSSVEVLKTNDKERLFLKSIKEIRSDFKELPPYEFEYNDPQSLPPRFSFAQDYWGYFNGETQNSHLVSSEGYLDFEESTISSNRNANGSYGSLGLLTKVIYPTGGSNEFEFESNTVNQLQTIYPAVESMQFTVDNGGIDEYMGPEPDIQYINNVPFTQNVFVNTSVMFNDYNDECSNEQGFPDHHIAGAFTIKDLSTNQLVNIYQKTESGTIPLGTSIDIDKGGMPYNDIFAVLIAGESYELKLNVPFYCVYGSASLSYYPEDITQEYRNHEIGGSRIKKIVTRDNSITSLKKYYYAALNDLDKSTGVANLPRSAYSTSYESISVNEAYKSITLSSSTQIPLFLEHGYHVGYANVIEGLGENFELGGVSHQYNINLFALPNVRLNEYIPGSSESNIFGNGQELKTTTFKKVNDEFIVLNSIVNTFLHDDRLDQELTVYNVSKRHYYSGFLANLTTRIDGYNIVEYKIKSQWHYLASKVESIYDINGQNPISINSNFFYNNTKHLQLSRSETINSDGNIMETKLYYPDDVQNSASLDGGIINAANLLAIENLKSQHRVNSVIQNERINNGNLVRSRTNYLDWTNVNGRSRNLTETVNINSAKGSSALEERVIFNDYDDFGNPLEMSKNQGTPVYYIWGYNESIPIAKIENPGIITTAQQNKIDEVKNLSNGDIDAESETTFRISLEGLRQEFPNSFITTYTYDPLIGLTSVTDPRGNTTHYEYDDFGRLKYVKDNEEFILSKNEYHYKGQ